MQISPAPSRLKSAAFIAVAVLLPFVVLLVLETALRLAGTGEVRRRPFQPIPGRSSHVALDPEYGAMYFRGFRPGVAFDPLQAEKPAGAFRVVALGGSTTAGFPYHWYYGFPARLEDQLAAALPGRRVEMANLGMTATNSFTIWDLAEHVAAQRPDAVVIYAGHNEFYGAYGTAGTQGWSGAPVALKRVLISASKWALVAGLGSLFDGDELPPGERRTMMARVVGNASIEYGGTTYRAGIAQFEANLREALEAFGKADIPVFLGTLASNLASQPPLGNEAAARVAFERGRELLAAGDTAAARAAFLEAKEADGLRFRAPEEINAVIRGLAETFSNVTLVDVQDRIRAASPGGLEGETFFTDHLHPNEKGYSLMAEAFFQGMRSSLPALRALNLPADPPDGLDPIEDRYARLQIAILTNGYPFRKDRTPAQAEASVRSEIEAMSRSGHYADELTAAAVRDGLPIVRVLDAAVKRARSEPDTLSTLRLYRALLHWQPFNESLMEEAVGLAVRNPEYDAETAALARYAANHSSSAFSPNVLAALAIRKGDLRRADVYLTAAERIDSHSPEMLFNRARLLVLEGDTTRARSYFERYRAVDEAKSR